MVASLKSLTKILTNSKQYQQNVKIPLKKSKNKRGLAGGGENFQIRTLTKYISVRSSSKTTHSTNDTRVTLKLVEDKFLPVKFAPNSGFLYSDLQVN